MVLVGNSTNPLRKKKSEGELRFTEMITGFISDDYSIIERGELLYKYNFVSQSLEYSLGQMYGAPKINQFHDNFNPDGAKTCQSSTFLEV